MIVAQAGCLHWFDGDEQDDEVPYELIKVGDPVSFSMPLPDLTKVYREKYKGDKLLSQSLAYRVWDFNKDGRYDLVEVINEKGDVELRAYDLDFDGKVDEVEHFNQ
ncbi:MAG: hypothetical protein HRU09_02040 [Oligoflexales bacterium]|nr:hypothetical protein [Oligoflexales bacterium]